MPSDTPRPAFLPVLLMRVSGQTLAIHQQDVAEVLPLPRLTPLPEAPPVVAGAFHLAGEIVLVLRLAALLGLAGPAEGDALYHHLLLLHGSPGEEAPGEEAPGEDAPRRTLRALLVDRATDSASAESAPLPAGESFNDCIAGDIRIDGALVPLLSARRLLTADEAAALEAFAARAAARRMGLAGPDGA
jgi:chemotaxis signal transduction protein